LVIKWHKTVSEREGAISFLIEDLILLCHISYSH
jgi:hypothetical protein